MFGCYGFRFGMYMVDICCGIGDFVVLVQKEYVLGWLVVLDYFKFSLVYVCQVVGEFGVKGIEYVYGDVFDMFLESDQFDFVICWYFL